MKNNIILFLIVIASPLLAQFTLPALPYAYNALEPYFDKETMEIHHSKHHATYVTNLNAEVSKDSTLKEVPLEKIIKNISIYSIVTRNNAGGHYNHSMFWTLLKPKMIELKKSTPTIKENDNSGMKVFKAIEKQFGSIEVFKEKYNTAAKTRFGSGWAWLIVSENGELKICSTANQDNPLMDIADVKGVPIIALDVWEHAYYLKYQNKRADYITAFWNILNWDEVEKRYIEAIK